ncbi:hypothetical protein ABHN03_07125 [Paenibacillus sp. NRS-1775]
MIRRKSHKNYACNNEYTISKRYEESPVPYEDPADYIRVPTLKGVRIA